MKTIKIYSRNLGIGSGIEKYIMLIMETRNKERDRNVQSGKHENIRNKRKW